MPRSTSAAGWSVRPDSDPSQGLTVAPGVVLRGRVPVQSRICQREDGQPEPRCRATEGLFTVLGDGVRVDGRRRYDARVGPLPHLIVLFVAGLVVGALARLLVPGPDPMGIGMTALVGLCGTFTAGLFSWYVLHRHGAGLLLSVLFSMLVVWITTAPRGAPTGTGLQAARSRA